MTVKATGDIVGPNTDPDPESHRWAVVPPLMAALVVRDYADVLRQWEARGQALVIAGQTTYGRQVLEGVRQIRDAGRARLASVVSDPGRSDRPMGEGGAESESGPPPGPGLTTRAVAGKLHLKSTRQVTRLIEQGRLSATWVGGFWLVDEVSLAQELERRRSAGHDDRRPGAA